MDRSNWDTRRTSVPSDSKNRGELTIEQEEELKKKIADTSWMIDKDKQQIQQTQDKVASYEYEFKKIQVHAVAWRGIDGAWRLGRAVSHVVVAPAVGRECSAGRDRHSRYRRVGEQVH